MSEKERQPLIENMDYRVREEKSDESFNWKLTYIFGLIVYVFIGLILLVVVDTEKTVHIFGREYMVKNVMLVCYLLLSSYILATLLNIIIVRRLIDIIFGKKLSKKYIKISFVFYNILTHLIFPLCFMATHNFGISLLFVELTSYLVIVILFLMLVMVCCPGCCSLCRFIVKPSRSTMPV